MERGDGEPHLLCRVGTHTCALPVHHVVETMRPLPIEPLAGTPRFVLGVSIIRGEPMPVLDGGSLLRDQHQESPTRFVTLKTGGRRIALAVDSVIGVQELATETLDKLPPLLDRADTEVIGAVGAVDSALLLVLRAGRLVPDEVWSMVEQRGE